MELRKRTRANAGNTEESPVKAADMPVRSRRTRAANTAKTEEVVTPTNGKRRRFQRGGGSADVEQHEGGSQEGSAQLKSPQPIEDSIVVGVVEDTPKEDEEKNDESREAGDRNIANGAGVPKRRKIVTLSEEPIVKPEIEAATDATTQSSDFSGLKSHRALEEAGDEKNMGNATTEETTKAETQVEGKAEDKVEITIPEPGDDGRTSKRGRGRPSKRKDEDDSTNISLLTPKRSKRSNGKEKASVLADGDFSPPVTEKKFINGRTSTTAASTSQDASHDTSQIDSQETTTRRRPRVVYDDPSEDDEEEAEQAYATPKKANRPKASSQTPKSAKKTAEVPSPEKRKGGRKGVWDKEVLLTSKRSKLAQADDLTDVLNSATWDLLSLEEQMECLSLLPVIDKVYYPQDNPDDTQQRPSLASEFFETNQVFKDSLVEFQDDLSNGRYEASYIAEAARARKERLNGKADKYKDGQYELFWGQRQRSGMIAGAAAQIKLPELIQRGVLKNNDIWAYKRRFPTVLIEKEVKIARIDNIGGKYSLVCHIPYGDHKFSNAKREDLVLEGVISPQTLETFILRNHSKAPNHIPNGNAFKCFNIWRKGEDLGLLWEIRQTYWGGE